MRCQCCGDFAEAFGKGLKPLCHELLIHHLEERDWTEEDRLHFLRMVGRSTLLSAQSALAVLEFQQATDERIQAEKDYDEVFCQPTL